MKQYLASNSVLPCPNSILFHCNLLFFLLPNIFIILFWNNFRLYRKIAKMNAKISNPFLPTLPKYQHFAMLPSHPLPSLSLCTCADVIMYMSDINLQTLFPFTSQNLSVYFLKHRYSLWMMIQNQESNTAQLPMYRHSNLTMSFVAKERQCFPPRIQTRSTCCIWFPHLFMSLSAKVLRLPSLLVVWGNTWSWGGQELLRPLWGLRAARPHRHPVGWALALGDRRTAGQDDGYCVAFTMCWALS